MKIKYLLLFIFIVLSFYVTDKVMIYINRQNPLMKEILLRKEEYKVEAVNAIIKDNTIIPGINGKVVDEEKSFNKMDSIGYFNDLFLEYNYISPNDTLKHHLNKIIIKGNSRKKMVSFIVYNNNLVSEYFDNNNIKYITLVKMDDKIDKNKKYINGEVNEELFSDLNSVLNKNKVNSKICLVNYSNIDICMKKKYYLVNYSINMNDNIIDNLNNISSGDIIFVDSLTNLYNIKNIINEIKRLDLEIDYLDVLISEES